MINDAYLSSPRRIQKGAAGEYLVFSESDEYVENYDKISTDHLAIFEHEGVNPFMSEDVWNESEEITAKLIKKFTPSEGLLLDVGCGMGRLLKKLPDYTRYGMDISSAYLNYATRGEGEFCLAKVEDMPYRSEYFDTVVCTDVLEHVLDLNVAVTQLFRVLKSGGYLVVRVPYRENLESYLRADFPYDMAHLRNFDEYSLRMLFEKIFNGKVVTQVLGPYPEHVGYLRWPIQFRGLGLLVRTFLRVCAWVSVDFKQRLARIIFRPVEISLVISKP
jgi:ubiquinone/menaquinone biosynthesis C-methylase UbiE